MELGATICLPKNPSCENCPIKKNCQGYKEEKNNVKNFNTLGDHLSI